MFSLFIRYFIKIACAIYTYLSILNLHLFPTKKYIFLIPTTISILCLITTLSTSSAIIRVSIVMVISYIFLTILFHNELVISLLTTIISYGISFIFYIIANMVVSAVFLSFYSNTPYFPYSYTNIPTLVLQSLLTFITLQNTQFKNGINTLILKGKVYIAFIISFLFILFIAVTSTNKAMFSNSIIYISNYIFLCLSFFLLYYWRHRIKQTYIENMRRMDIRSYENAIADRDKQILTLQEENAQLGRIVHKYRKIIPAMELSVMELFQSGEELSHDNLKERSQALQMQLAEMREEPDTLLAQYQKGRIVATQTGLHTVDAMIALMEKRAKQEQIRYKVQTEPDIRELALRSVKEPDLLHLLGDLLENAIHAESTTDTKELLIHFGKLNDCLLLEVLDSGVPFDIRTYQHLGQEAYTSHEQDGGSGIGLMDIWKIKREYKASLYIYEYESNAGNYTKKISFLFDGKNHFLLKTYRDKEIRNALIRGDLHVFPHETD